MELLKQGKYYGCALKRRELNGILLLEKNHAAKEAVPLHAHENSYICTVLNGNWKKTINRNSVECSPLTSVFHRPNEEHSDIFLTESKVFDIEIDNSWRDFFQNHSAPFVPYKVFVNNRLNWIASRIYHEFSVNRHDSPLIFEGLIVDLISSAFVNTPKELKEKGIPLWLKNVREYVDENYFRSISFREVSNEADVHPVHLVRSFKSAFNTNIGEYQRLVRVRKACEKLLYSEHSYAEIALQTGFYDQSHFYRIFKKLTGLNPAAYRKLYKN